MKLRSTGRAIPPKRTPPLPSSAPTPPVPRKYTRSASMTTGLVRNGADWRIADRRVQMQTRMLRTPTPTPL